jgi:signal transduction histidine kinase
VIERLATIRAITTIVATIVVAIALTVGAIALVAAAQRTMVDEVTEAAGKPAAEVVGQLESGRPPVLEVAGSDEQMVQVMTPAGAVVASSSNVAGEPAVARLAPGQSAQVITPLDNDAFIAVAQSAQTANGQRIVLVARALVDVLDTTKALTRLLIIGLPVMLAVVALATWFAVGRALAPVEAIRREVDEISAAQLHRRVPQLKADDEIGRLAATMNRMLERLESARNSQRRFVSDASHELRSPITTIRQHAEVALAHPDRVTAAELAEVVLAEQQRMHRLVEDLLLLARVDEHVPLTRAAVDLDDLAFEEGHRLRSTTSKRVDTSGVKAVRVQGDADALRRMVRNVGENAVRHASSRVDVTLVERGEEVVLTIDDDGPGIPATERARVLQRFVRLDEARSRDEGGSGLGLSIVDEVVRAHGGSMSIEQSPLGGARIVITLPVQAVVS